jgi:CRAL/TRIO-like protein
VVILYLANNLSNCRKQVLNAPSYFGLIWRGLKKWVDPRTADKLVILSPEEVLPTLKQTIDLSSIPSQFGGMLQFQHGAVPSLDVKMCRQLIWPSEPAGTFPTGPVKWIADHKGCRTAVAVGRLEGTTRYEKIFKMMDTKHM